MAIDMKRTGACLLAVASVIAVAGCRETAAAPPAKTANASAVSSRTDAAAVLATIGGTPITMADVHTQSGEQLDKLQTQYELARSRLIGTALDSIVRGRLLSAESQKRGKSVDELILAEAGSAGLEPTEVEVAAWYKDNAGRLGGRTIDQLRSQIVDFLRTEHRKAAAQKLEERLKAEQHVTRSFEPYRVVLANDNAPSKGNHDAPVTLVEFSDFQCPYCRGLAPTLKAVEETLGDRVRIVYRQYPIPSLHPFATKAAEASLCANELGKFWEMHDAMFNDQSKLAVSDLKQTARRVGVDGKKFDACLDAGRYVEQVQNDQKEGQRIGVNGTPAMFVNGIPIEGGAVGYDAIKAAIQREIDRQAGQRGPASP
jgi:protein-disulfide isomerase